MKKIFEKKSHNAEKTERRDPLGFFNIRSVEKLQKKEGGTLWGTFFFEKSLTEPKSIQSFSDDVKRRCKLLRHHKRFSKVMKIVRKLDHSE